MDLFAALQSSSSIGERVKHKRVKAIKKCECLESHSFYHDAGRNEKYPQWIGFYLPHRYKNNEYEFELKLNNFFKIKSVEIGSVTKMRKIFIFFANAQDAFDLVPTISYEGNSSLIFKKFPYSLKTIAADIHSPNLCLASSGKLMAILACRSQDESSVPIGLFEFSKDKSSENNSKQTGSIYKKYFDEYWCCDTRNKKNQFENFSLPY